MMPKRLRSRFELASNDAELLSLRTDLAALDAKMVGCFEKLRDDAGPDRRTILEQIDDIVEHGKIWDSTTAEQRLQALAEAVRPHRDAESTWAEIRSLMNQKAKLVMQESRRLIALEQTLTVEEAILLATALGDIVRRHVHDPEILHKISREWGAFINNGPNRPMIS